MKCRIRYIYMFVIMVITILLTGAPLGTIYYSKLVILMFVLSGVMFVFNKRHIRKKRLVYVGMLILLIIISMLVNFDMDFSHYLGIFLTFLSILMISCCIPQIVFEEIYVYTITVISVISLLFTFYFNIVREAVSQLDYIVYEGAGSWYTFHNIYNIWGYHRWIVYIRNSGFFREPGVMGMHVCVAGIILLKNMSENGKLSRHEMFSFICLVLAGITTMSTVGVIGVALLVVLYFIKLNTLKPMHLVVAIVGILVGAYIFVDKANMLFDKFNPNNISYVSFTERALGIGLGFSVALKYPIFGAGYSIFQEAMNGNIITFYFPELWAKYGFLFPCIITWGMFLYSKKATRTWQELVVVIVILALFAISQGLWISPVFLLLQLYGITVKEETQI